MWTKKQKRAYHRAKSGVKVADILHLPVKHMVLTTSPEASMRDIARDFQTLNKSIFRTFGFKLPVFMVHTSEGNCFFQQRINKRGKVYYHLLGGVLHILYRGKFYIPQQWLSNEWSRIHHSSYVYIKQVPDTDIARYVVTQYVSNQASSYQRCSWSHSWVKKGFVKEWSRLLRWYRQYQRKKNLDFIDLLMKWDAWLRASTTFQTSLIDFG